MNKLTDNLKKEPVAPVKSFIRTALENIQVEFIGESVSDVKPVDIESVCAILESKWAEELEKSKEKWQKENIEFLKREIMSGNQIIL